MFTICRAVATVMKVMKPGVDNFHMYYFNNTTMFQCFMILKSLHLKVVNLWSDFRKKSFATLHRDVAIGVVLVP